MLSLFPPGQLSLQPDITFARSRRRELSFSGSEPSLTADDKRILRILNILIEKKRKGFESRNLIEKVMHLLPDSNRFHMLDTASLTEIMGMAAISKEKVKQSLQKLIAAGLVEGTQDGYAVTRSGYEIAIA